MKTLDDITSEIKKILKDQWSVRHGEKVPETSEIKLGNEGVSINATVLYADLKRIHKNG